MTIQIDGLSHRQRVLASVLWTLESQEEVSRFINSLPPEQAREAYTVMQLMMWATLDQVDDTDLAVTALKGIGL